MCVCGVLLIGLPFWVINFLVLTLFRAVFIVVGGIKASNGMHNNLLNSIMHAPLLFFNSNPIGRILNRFSRDLQQMDEWLPNTLHMFLEVLMIIMSVFIIICMNSPYLIILFPIMST